MRRIKDKIKKTTKIIIMAISIIIALYVGVWVMFAGGIIQIINGISPLNGTDIAIGILKIIFCEIAGLIPIVGFGICELVERI